MYKTSFFHSLKSEFIKLFTAISSYALLFSAWVLSFFLTYLDIFRSWDMSAQDENGNPVASWTIQNIEPKFFWEQVGSGPASIVSMFIGITAILLIGMEYNNKFVWNTLLATPKRHIVYLSKLTVTVCYSLIAMMITLFGTFSILYSFLNVQGDKPGFGESLAAGLPEYFVWPVIGMTLLVMMAFGIGFLLRGSLAGILGYIGIMQFVPIFMNLVRGALMDNQDIFTMLSNIIYVMPDSLASRIAYPFTLGENVSANGFIALSQVQSIGVLCIWTASSLIGGFLLFRHRDA